MRITSLVFILLLISSFAYAGWYDEAGNYHYGPVPYVPLERVNRSDYDARQMERDANEYEQTRALREIQRALECDPNAGRVNIVH